LLLRRDIEFSWVSDQDQVLQQLKDILLRNVTLQFLDMNASFFVQTDSSSYASAHTILQIKDEVLKTVSTGAESQTE
jgi:RNase H-like domain found in reverse transcriptase